MPASYSSRPLNNLRATHPADRVRPVGRGVARPIARPQARRIVRSRPARQMRCLRRGGPGPGLGPFSSALSGVNEACGCVSADQAPSAAAGPYVDAANLGLGRTRIYSDGLGCTRERSPRASRPAGGCCPTYGGRARRFCVPLLPPEGESDSYYLRPRRRKPAGPAAEAWHEGFVRREGGEPGRRGGGMGGLGLWLGAGKGSVTSSKL